MSSYISITGSKGKSTVLFLIQHIITKCLKNKNVITVSSTEGRIYNGKFIEKSKVSNYFSTKVNNIGQPLDFYVTEATSNLLAKGYYKNINTSIAVFTGIEKTEHLDVHKTFNNYLLAKKSLFDGLSEESYAIVNSDSPYCRKILEDCKSKHIIKYGFSQQADYRISIRKISKFGMKLQIIHNTKTYELKTKLIGESNAMNILAALIVSIVLQCNDVKLLKCFNRFEGVDGRFHRFYLSNGKIVIIDYAHTPESLEGILKTLKKIYKSKRIITIFGCGGNKSFPKRSLMGKVSAQFSDYVIITNDNPRFENELVIANDIVSGMKSYNTERDIVLNRKEALKKAILYSNAGIILLAGKGNEKEAIYSKFDDHTGKRIICAISQSDYQLLSEVTNEYSLGLIEGRSSGILKRIFPR